MEDFKISNAHIKYIDEFIQEFITYNIYIPPDIKAIYNEFDTFMTNILINWNNMTILEQSSTIINIYEKIKEVIIIDINGKYVPIIMKNIELKSVLDTLFTEFYNIDFRFVEDYYLELFEKPLYNYPKLIDTEPEMPFPIIPC